jgi:hypothetical protein
MLGGLPKALLLAMRLSHHWKDAPVFHGHRETHQRLQTSMNSWIANHATVPVPAAPPPAHSLKILNIFFFAGLA